MGKGIRELLQFLRKQTVWGQRILHYTRTGICKTKNNPLTLQANEQMYGEAVQFISDWYKP